MATAVAAAARPILLLALITSVDFWATDSDLGLAYTEMKDGDGDKSRPQFRTHVPTHKFSDNVLLHTRTVPDSYYTPVQCQRGYYIRVQCQAGYYTQVVPTWLLHSKFSSLFCC